MAGSRVQGLARPKLDIRVTYSSAKVFLLHIEDESSSRWLDLLPEDAGKLAEAIQAKLSEGPED